MHLQGPDLASAERTLLEQDRVGNADLADVVQQEAVAQLRVGGEGRLDDARERDRQICDAARVLSCLVVA